MKPSTERALNRLLRAMERPPRPRRRLSSAPVVLGLGLILGQQLLARLVPRVWGSLLPGGLEQARTLRGWPGLVWGLAVACHRDASGVLVVIAGLTFGALLLSWWIRPLRFLVWLAAVAVIGLDAGILYVTLRTAAEATARAAGMS